MLKLCDDNHPAIGTIAGGPVNEPYDVRLDSFWRHDSVKAALPRKVRAALIREACRYVVGGDA